MLKSLKNSQLWRPFSWLYRKSGLKAVVYSRSYKKLVQTISIEKFLQFLNPTLDIKRTCIFPNISLPFNIESGPMPFEDQQAMIKILSFLDPSSIFEFGTNWGFTTAIFVQNTSSKCKIYTLDVCREMFNKDSLANDKELDMILSKQQTGMAYKQLPESANKVIQIFQDSLKLNWMETDYPDFFDIILVDACHKYNYVKSDTENSIKKLKTGGILLWHDYYPDVSAWTDVFRYINDFAKTYQPVFHLKGTHIAAWIKA